MPMFRLTKRGGDGLCCDASGVALEPVALVEAAAANGRRVYRVRPAEEVARTLALAYEPFTTDDLARRLSGLDVAARALEAGDLAKAAVATVLLKLPPLSPKAIAKLAHDPTLKKYSPDQYDLRDANGNPRPFSTFVLEQQTEIVQDYFLSKNGRPPARSGQKAFPLSIYERVLEIGTDGRIHANVETISSGRREDDRR